MMCDCDVPYIASSGTNKCRGIAISIYCFAFGLHTDPVQYNGFMKEAQNSWLDGDEQKPRLLQRRVSATLCIYTTRLTGCMKRRSRKWG